MAGRRARAQRRAEAGIDRSQWYWQRLRLVGGLAILAVLVGRLGGDAILDSLGTTDAGSLVQGGAAGVVIIAVTTACGAWRWKLVARQLHVELSMLSAVDACYRSQFLNLALPGGVLGDLGRGMQHGLRAVAWDRAAGQVVLGGITLPVLLVARPFASPSPVATGWVMVVAAALMLVLLWSARDRRHGVVPRLVRGAHADARALLDPSAVVGIVLASVVVVAGHAATFVVAARAVGVRTPLFELVPVALVVLLVSAVPLNVGGWGPREGGAAWAFAAAGLGATRGLAVAVAFGVIVLVATLPGAVLLAGRARWPRSSRPRPRRSPTHG